MAGLRSGRATRRCVGSCARRSGEFNGIDGLENALLARPELFVTTLTENLMTFALGRGVEYYDAPAVRKIVRDAEKDGYRFSSLILGIVKSVPFQMRSAEIRKRPQPGTLQKPNE